MAKVSLRAYNREIETMIDRNHLDEAIAHCKHILKSFPKHLETYRLLGKAYLEYKRHPEAVDIFSRVLVAVPNDFVSNVGMSIIRDEENRLDDAIWHMERAFETQPSNSAIQSELQRLYSRRDGVQLPRIRMTHGALAHMYVKGELYPQAISEIKNVLNEDPARHDMQSLLARAYFQSGARNDAADEASALLRSEPYSMDANRILVEILGTDHPENVQAYRQRVIELDPYAAQVSGSIFRSDEVPDVAVSVERLDWNGQPVGLEPDWESRQAISLESSSPSEEQPDWLKSTTAEASPPFGETPVPSFDAEPPPAEPADEIPDFLRAAGWGQASGAFDESKSVFEENEPAPGESAIAPGELPDWVKAMAPEQPAESSAPEEELPDWINKIDKSTLPEKSEPAEQPDWTGQIEEPTAPSVEGQPDWLKQLDASEPSEASALEQPDWLKGFENEAGSSPPSTGELDWLNHLDEEAKPAEEPPQELDFLKELAGESEQSAPASEPSSEPSLQNEPGMSSEEQEDAFAWLENLAAKQGATEGLLTRPEDRMEDEPDWIKQSKTFDKSAGQPPAEQPEVRQPAGDMEELGKSQQEQDDSFAWLESLAAKQGATEGLLTRPEERLDEEPEWIRQAKDLGAQPQEPPASEATQYEPGEPPAMDVEPAASIEQPGQGDEERDDAFAWLENPVTDQGVDEVPLSAPEEEWKQEPEAVVQAGDVRAGQISESEPLSSMEATAAWLHGLDEDEAPSSPESAPSRDDTAMWFKGLESTTDEEPAQPVQDRQPEELPEWMQGIEEDRASETQFNIPTSDLAAREPEPQTAGAAETEDLPAWLQGIDEDKAADTDLNIPAVEAPAPSTEKEASVDTEWMSALESQPTVEATEEATEAAKESAEELPGWLGDLDEEQQQQVTPGTTGADLPAWLRDETGELPAEPTRIEPTRTGDWQPAETKSPEPEPEPVRHEVEAQPPSPEPEPELVMAEAEPGIPAAPAETAEAVNIIEERIEAVQEPEAPSAPPTPPRERKSGGTGEPGMPLDPILGQARSELSGSNLAGALENYALLIKKGRFLDEVIFDLRDALYRFPVDVDIWQSLGDAYMRANRLQDALDAYTKAEELLR